VRRHLASAGTVELGHELQRSQHRIAGSRGTELQRLKQVMRELAQGPPAIGGTQQRILFCEIGQILNFATNAQKLGPADYLIDHLKGVAVTLLGCGERFDRAVEQAHQPADVAGTGYVAAARGVARFGKQAADELVGHGLNRTGFPGGHLV
jgi:hypothetical protein